MSLPEPEQARVDDWLADLGPAARPAPVDVADDVSGSVASVAYRLERPAAQVSVHLFDDNGVLMSEHRRLHALRAGGGACGSSPNGALLLWVVADGDGDEVREQVDELRSSFAGEE